MRAIPSSSACTRAIAAATTCASGSSKADCVLQLGALPTDFNTGGFTVKLSEDRTISANYRSVQIKRHIYPDVTLRDFILGLTGRLRRWDAATLDIQRATEGCTHRRTIGFEPEPGRPLTVRRFFDRVGHFLEPGAVVIAETGVALFSAAETLMPEGAKFIGQTFYGSIGYTVGATLARAWPHRIARWCCSWATAHSRSPARISRP